MNRSINRAFEIIFNNGDLTEEFFRQDTPEKLYKFCNSVHSGYTKEEFDEYINDTMNEIEKEDFDLKLNEDNLKNISGGSGKRIYNKTLSYALASLVLVTPAIPSSYAAEDATTHQRGSIMQVSKPSPRKSFWERNKEKIIGSGLFAAILGTYLAFTQPWKTKNPIENPINNPLGNNDGEKSDKGSSRASEIANDPETFVRSKINESTINFLKRHQKWGWALLAPATLSVVLEKLGNISKNFNQTTGAYYSVQRMKEAIESWIKYKENIRNNKPVEMRQSFDNIDNLFNEIKGQEKAKKEVRRLVFDILHKKKNAELTGNKYSRGDVLYFYGPSRVGKTLMAEGLARHKILSTSTEPYYISASEVDKDSSKETVLDQLFGMSSYGGYGGFDEYGGYYGGAAGGNIKKPKNLVKYINENPNGIVIIDEYDKMWSPALDEVFRTIMDRGMVNVKGQTIDCSGMTFILTSNECTASIKGGNQYSGGNIDDGTGSRTFIKHDKSFLNRVKPVEFENLSAEAYEGILRKEAQIDVIDYWARPEIAGFDVVIPDDVYKSMAESVERRNEGASHAQTLIQTLLSDITNKAMMAEEIERDYYRGKKIIVDFNPKGDTFTLRESTESIVQSEKESDKPQDNEKTDTDTNSNKPGGEEDAKSDGFVSDIDYEKTVSDRKSATDWEDEYSSDMLKDFDYDFNENGTGYNDAKDQVGGQEGDLFDQVIKKPESFQSPLTGKSTGKSNPAPANKKSVGKKTQESNSKGRNSRRNSNARGNSKGGNSRRNSKARGNSKGRNSRRNSKARGNSKGGNSRRNSNAKGK